MPICDFCSSASPAWRYPAQSFQDEFGSRSVSDWLACEECHRLIEAGNRDGLAARVMLTPTAIALGIDPVAAQSYARGLHDGFFRNRRGTAMRVAKEGV